MATLNGTEGNDTIVGGADNDVINGFGGNDNIQAGGGSDTVLGGAGNDTISGNDGTDWVEGGAGNEEVRGGPGQDSIAFQEYQAQNADVLSDFDAGWDNLQFDANGFIGIGPTGQLAPGDPRFYSAPGATQGHDADDRLVYDTSTGNLYFDGDGSGLGVSYLVATIPNRTPLGPTDIWVFKSGPSGEVINGTSGD